MITKLGFDLQRALTPAPLRQTPENLLGTEEDAKKIMKGFGVDKNTDFYPSKRMKYNAFYAPKTTLDGLKDSNGIPATAEMQALHDYLKKEKHIPKENGVIVVGDKIPLDYTAHEAGHASGGKVRKVLMRYMYPLGPIGACLGGSAIGGMASGAVDRKRGLALLGVSAVPLVAQLGEEGVSSIKGYRKLKELGLLKDKEAEHEAKKRLGFAYSTYVLGNALAGLAGYAINKKVR